MLFDEADQLTMLEALGETATIGTDELTVLFRGRSSNVAYAGGEFDEVLPTAIALSSYITDLSITAGEAGSQITINEITYTVISIEPDEAGFSVLVLGAEAPDVI